MTTHRIGTYNVEFGHPPAEHAQMILDRFEHEKLDALALVEAQDYTADLERIAAPASHRVLVIHGHRGADHVALLVRAGCKIGKIWTFRAGLPYYRKGGGLMAPTQPLAAVVDGIRYVVVHAPVQAWVATRHGRTFSGPLRRRGAYTYFVTRLALLFTRQRRHPVCALGDWNATPDTGGRWSPEWLRQRADGQFLRPHASTGHGEIDFAITRGLTHGQCHVRPDQHGQPHSDHRLVVATVTAKEK